MRPGRDRFLRAAMLGAAEQSLPSFFSPEVRRIEVVAQQARTRGESPGGKPSSPA